MLRLTPLKPLRKKINYIVSLIDPLFIIFITIKQLIIYADAVVDKDIKIII